GSGTYKPISGQESAPNSFEGAGSVILSPDHKFLFATNGGNNSVSSFAVSEQGRLKLIDTKPTPRTERYTCNTPEKPNRVPTMAVLSPDEKFLLVGTTFDVPIAISGTY